MQNDITPYRLANAIMMQSKAEKYFVLTEGETDLKLFKKFFNKDIVEIRPTFGCNKLIECIDILIKEGCHKYIGILDSDFHRILGTVPYRDNLFFNDYHDIEIMMTNSTALSHIITTSGKETDINKFEVKKKDSLLNIIMKLAGEIGYLKLATMKYDLGLKFTPEKPEGNQISYGDFISTDLCFSGYEIMIKKIIDYSRNKGTIIKSYNDILIHYKSISANTYDIKQLANGHDVTNILSLFFKKCVKCPRAMVANHAAITDSLILAYDITEFMKTDLHKSLSKWSKIHNIGLFN